MHRKTGAEIIVGLLERQGVRALAGIPGGMNLPLYDALSHSQMIRHILARHEQGAGFIAQGMARISGRPEVCLATSGPGATNIITAVADAKLDSVPMVCITGQVPLGMIGTDAFQEVDTYGMTIPITKHNFLVRSAAELLEVMPEAFRIAWSGRPGPVLVDVPKDVQNQMVEFDAWPEPGRPDRAPEFDHADLQRAAAMINAAQRPLFYLGGGAIQANAGGVATRLAEKAGIPAVMTLMGLGAIPSSHPRSLGMLGMHAARHTNLALEECDLLIAAGVRFDDRATGRLAQFCPKAKIIHIDIDLSEIDKLRIAQIGIIGNVCDVFRALFPLVDALPRTEWLERIEELRRTHPMVMPGSDDPSTPYGLIRLAASLLDEEAIITTDVGQHQMWTAQAYPHRRPRRWLTSGGLGTMGFGLPAAIGASFAAPGRTVVSFSGDGSIMMNLQELATAVEEGANVKVIVMNNNTLGLVRQQQDLFYGQRVFASRFRNRVDFVRIAEGFGMRAYDLADCADPADLLERAFHEPGPCLVHAPIDAAETVYPMVPPGAANRDMIGGETHACANA